MVETHIRWFSDDIESQLWPLTQNKSFLDLRLGALTLRERWNTLNQNLSPDKNSVLWIHPGLVLSTAQQDRWSQLAAMKSFWIDTQCVAFMVPLALDSQSCLSHLNDSDWFKHNGFQMEPIEGRLLQHPHDVLDANAFCLTHDVYSRSQSHSDMIDCVGDSSLLSLGKNCSIYGRITINVEQGPVVIADNVVIKAPTMIEGPAFIGESSVVNGARIRPYTSIGPVCKISGEISGTVFESFSNKAHDGYVGDSYIGSWVNMGAMTTTSNLKNTYGTVSYGPEQDKRDSGRMHLGSLIANYVTLGVGTWLPTGAVIETGVNFFGGGLCPTYVPAFVWGSQQSWQTYRLEKMLQVFATMKQRRDQVLSDQEARSLTELFSKTQERREAFLGERS